MTDPLDAPRFLPSRLHSFLLALLIFLIASALALTLAWLGSGAYARLDRERFDSLTLDITSTIEARLNTHLSLIASAGAMVKAFNGDLGRAPYRAFVSGLPLDTYYAGIQGLGIARRTTPQDREAVEARLRADYDDPLLAIKPPLPQVQFPIVLLEPDDARNRAALGFDMFSEPARQEAMMRASASGRPVMTGKVVLKQEIDPDKQAGFLIYLPIHLAAGQEEASFYGFAYAPFRAGDFFAAALSPNQTSQVRLTLYDSVEEESYRLFTSSASQEVHAFSTLRQLDFAGRRWLLRFESLSGFERQSASRFFGLVALSALIAAAFLAIMVWQMMEARRKAMIAAAESRQSARDKTLLMQEMRHRLGNMIAKVQSIARQSARGAPDLRSFMTSFEPRLTSMAALNELLMRTSWEGASLKDVLDAELGPYTDADKSNVTLTGPDVSLSARLVLVLGLTLHELATNASKYGGLSDHGQGLDVSWSVAGRLLKLVWRESVDGAPDENARTGGGFGSRLIAMTIERELGGTCERDFAPGGLVCHLTVPL